jgi:hypothetical protein
MVVGLDPRMALRVVAHVDKRLGCVRREEELLEELAGPGALLVDLNVEAWAGVRIADCVGAALGDPRKERLGSERFLHGTGGAQAVSGDATHFFLQDPFHEEDSF